MLRFDPPKCGTEPLAASSKTPSPRRTPLPPRHPPRSHRRICTSRARPLRGSSFDLQTRFPRRDRSTPPKICYNDSAGLQTDDMRIAAMRFLAILTIAALLAPGVRGSSVRAPVEACACPPAACMCAGHHHAFGHIPSCCTGNGGQCGLESHDSYLSSLLSTLIYVPTEHPWSTPLAPWRFGHDASGLSLLPSHARIPEQPPRAAL